MQKTKKQSHPYLDTKSSRALILLLACLLGGATSRFLAAQTVRVSVWSSEIDHSLESVIVFQSQSRDGTDACIHIYDNILAQQIAQIGVAAPSGTSTAIREVEAPPSIDQEADTLIVNPMNTGAETIGSAPGSNTDFLLMTQLSRVVKQKAYRIASAVAGSDDLESVAFRNPDGTYVLFTVNHSKSPLSLEAFWKDRMLTYSQAGRSIAIFAWDPKSQLVSLVPSEPRISANGSFSVKAKCLNLSPLGIDFRCESGASYCSIFPVRFTCNAQQESVILSVFIDEIDTVNAKPGFVTITAAPDVGEPTSLSAPCCRARR